MPGIGCNATFKHAAHVPRDFVLRRSSSPSTWPLRRRPRRLRNPHRAFQEWFDPWQDLGHGPETDRRHGEKGEQHEQPPDRCCRVEPVRLPRPGRLCRPRVVACRAACGHARNSIPCDAEHARSPRGLRREDSHPACASAFTQLNAAAGAAVMAARDRRITERLCHRFQWIGPSEHAPEVSRCDVRVPLRGANRVVA